MVFPLVGDNIFEDFFVYGAPADVDGEVFALMLDLEQLCDRVDVVAVQLLDARGWEGHGDNPGGDIGEVQVVPLLAVPVLRTADYLAQEVHRLFG